MKFITIRDSEFYSLENVKKIYIDKITSNKHTSCGVPYYLYDGFIHIEYFNNEKNLIRFDNYEDKKLLESHIRSIFDWMVEVLAK